MNFLTRTDWLEYVAIHGKTTQQLNIYVDDNTQRQICSLTQSWGAVIALKYTTD